MRGIIAPSTRAQHAINRRVSFGLVYAACAVAFIGIFVPPFFPVASLCLSAAFFIRTRAILAAVGAWIVPARIAALGSVLAGAAAVLLLVFVIGGVGDPVRSVLRLLLVATSIGIIGCLFWPSGPFSSR